MVAFQSLLEQPQWGIIVIWWPGMVKRDGTNLLKANPWVDFQFPLVTDDTFFATFEAWAAVNYDWTNYTQGNTVFIEQAWETWIHNWWNAWTTADFTIVKTDILTLNSSPSVNDTYTGITALFESNTTIAQWEIWYILPSSTIGLWDASTVSSTWPLVLATEALTAWNSGLFLMQWIVRNDGWTWSSGGVTLYLSLTPWEMTETAPSGTDEVIQICGYALSADTIYWNPQLVTVIHT